MASSHHAETKANHVVALYADRILSFRLSRRATLADLAERLDQLSGQHTSTPTAIYLAIGMARRSTFALQDGS